MIDYKSLLKQSDGRDFLFPNYKVGAELEFYILGNRGYVLETICDLESGKYPKVKYSLLPRYERKFYSFTKDLAKRLDEAKIFLLPVGKLQLPDGEDYSNKNHKIIEQERGCAQFEVSFTPNSSAFMLASQIKRFRTIINTVAESFDFKILFAPRPIKEQPGNGLHLHISLYDAVGSNVFANSPQLLESAVAGILKHAKDDIRLYFPTEEHYARVVKGYDAPTKLCWGGNNRTTALRVPDCDTDKQNKRIENRLACADCDIDAIIYKNLVAVDEGIRNSLTPPEKVYGNAYDPQYKFPLIRYLVEEYA